MNAKMLAKHVGDEMVVTFAVSLGLDKKADECIGDLLSMVVPDLKTLAWFRTQWRQVSVWEPSCARAIGVDEEMVLDAIRTDKLDDLVQTLRNAGMPDANDWGARADESLLSRSREYHLQYVKTMQSILTAPTAYEKKHAELEAMEDRLARDLSKSDVAVLTAAFATPALSRLYGLQVKTRARTNALGAALEIYIARAKTGELPDQLPAGVSKDPFSGMDYLYEKTDSGFVLRCRGKDLDEGMIHEFTFTVK